MKILVYGCGAIGSLLIHFLCEGENEVTVAARSTYEDLKQNGLVIEHALQKKTTIDHPRVVVTPDENEEYDIVFSVMQGQQQLKLLDTLPDRYNRWKIYEPQRGCHAWTWRLHFAGREKIII